MTKFILLFILSISALAQAAHQTSLSCTPGTGGGTPTGFNFKRATSAAGPFVTIGSPTTCAFTDSSAAFQIEGTTYFYLATAVNAKGESAPSNVVSTTVPITGANPPTMNPPVTQ